jgi:hypothetical protein
MAKMQREQRVKERRALKAEKKQAAREAKAAGVLLPDDTTAEETDVEMQGADEVAATPESAGLR